MEKKSKQHKAEAKHSKEQNRVGVSPAGTAHKGSQQKPILTMQLPKEVGTEGPAAKVINKRPAREGGLCPLLCARGRGPASPLPRVPAGGCGIRHTGRGMVGSGAPGEKNDPTLLLVHVTSL